MVTIATNARHLQLDGCVITAEAIKCKTLAFGHRSPCLEAITFTNMEDTSINMMLVLLGDVALESITIHQPGKIAPETKAILRSLAHAKPHLKCVRLGDAPVNLFATIRHNALLTWIHVHGRLILL